MTPHPRRFARLIGIVITLLVPPARAAIEFQRLPAGGLQPEAVVTADHTAHLLWLGGEPRAADVFYQPFAEGREAAAAPIRVNSQAGSAIALGTIRGARLAVGRPGRVHVVWNGSGSAQPRPKGSAPLLYSRLADGGRTFEPQRNLVTRTTDLDGGGAIAADGAGNVFAIWHGGTPGRPSGEANRQVVVARSGDEGKSFTPETAVSEDVGACGCCGMSAFSDANGNIFALFRAARAGVHRDATLLVSRDHAATFVMTPLQEWETGSCPMSSSGFGFDRRGVLAAWETRGKIFFTPVPGTGRSRQPIEVASGSGAKHPALATNSRGETLLVWTEGTGWQRGGEAAWQVFDADGKPTDEHGRKPGIPVWSFAAAYARPDNSFVIVF